MFVMKKRVFGKASLALGALSLCLAAGLWGGQGAAEAAYIKDKD